MRFITEFDKLHFDNIDRTTQECKEIAEKSLGGLIIKSFGWEYKNTIHRLEIEAFPMDKWIEFKRRLFVHFDATGIYAPGLKNLVSELESFGKPSGDIITNLSDDK